LDESTGKGLNMKRYRFALLLGAAVALSACTNMGLFKDSNEPAAPAPVEPQLSPQGFSGEQIKSILAGKSWRWQGPNNSGTTLYASDGTSLVEVDGKGTTSGKWEARNGQLCESFSPAPFLPQGMDTVCQPFSGSGNTYQVGPATFTLA
jgi:hypothetical protein